ncbi:MAG: sugar porter family MFS transporter [Kiritimatiellae bacterium]|nr:sugar porter family MFS transporter [Kiritimatiellia bacterium]
MNARLFYIVVVAAIGGFLFGFDSGVISGCEKAIQGEFGLSAFWHGLIISGALIGTVIGVFTAGRPSDRWGRKPTLWLMAVLFLVSAVGCAFTPYDAAWGPHLLGWFRFVGGLAIGGVSVVVPLYIVEVSPGKYRGRLVAMNQLNIVLGILVSYVSNLLVAWLMPDADPRVVWRVMLGVECAPIALFMALLATIPESPRWLVRAGREDAARGVLERIGYPDVERTVGEIVESLRAAAGGVEVALFQRRYLKPIMLAFLIAFFNQVSGINAINYYAPRIFQMIFGEGSEMAALAGTVGVGAVNLVFTMLAFLVIDRFGRRAMIVGGSAMMIAMHALVAWQLSLPSPNAAIAVSGILGFIAFFAISSGAVIWVYISEVFPNTVRAKGQALGCFTHWFMCTVISWAFPAVAERAGTWAFAFFAAMMAVQLVWALFFMPETKGGTIEDIETRLGIGESE